jgi:hypothetical protein
MRCALLAIVLFLIGCGKQSETEVTEHSGKENLKSIPQVSGPYMETSTNLIYQLLFCDRPRLFEDNHDGPVSPPWSVLFDNAPDLDAIEKIANDTEAESRIRMLAFNALRTANSSVQKKEFLGTIIEVSLPDGLDTLAVFADGGARYINHSGKIAIVEGAPTTFQAEIEAVIEASKAIVEAIGPWEDDRLPAPKQGNIRMTFLVSDGLYFGEGPMDAMQHDPMASPLINAATSLLRKLVDRTTDSEPIGASKSPVMRVPSG